MNQRTLAAIPERFRDDAVQEAWLASLQGHNPRHAAAQYAKNEIRFGF